MASELELRTCGRAGCRWPAAASLSFRYETRQVWLSGLAPEPHPALYDLCPHHADALTVPRGWERVDEREPQETVREPSGHDLEVRARARAEPVDVGGGNRYAALVDELPRLAEEYGTTRAPASPAPGAAESPPAPGAAESPPAPGAAESPPAPAAPEPRRAPRVRESPPPAPVPSRDLAPVPLEARPPTRSDAVPRPSGDHPGQLAIPVDGIDEAGKAVVVSIERAGARRRPDMHI